MSLATSLRSAASKLIGKFGGDIVLRTISNGAYNATSGTIVENITDTPIRGVLGEINNREVGGLVLASDKKLTIAAADVAAAPTIQDRVVVNSVVHQVIQVVIVEQDNEPITYELLLRS